MKILIVTYPRIGLNHGGLEIQIEQTVDMLRKCGLEISLFDPWQNQINDTDIVHIFSIDGSSLAYALRAKELGKQIVISPVFNCFAHSLAALRIAVRLSRFPGLFADLRRAKKLLDLADVIIALNEQEKIAICKSFGILESKIVMIPNGINIQCLNGNPELFEQKYGVKNFALEVGSIEKRKNQLSLIQAMQDIPYPLLIIGPTYNAESLKYLEQCKRAAQNNVIFTGALSSHDPLLASAYAAAKVYVLPSYSEVMPLTVYEAAAAGCKVIASTRYPIAPEISKYVRCVAPDDIKGLREAILEEMQAHDDGRLKTAARNMPSWGCVANMIKEVYTNILKNQAHDKSSQTDQIRDLH